MKNTLTCLSLFLFIGLSSAQAMGPGRNVARCYFNTPSDLIGDHKGPYVGYGPTQLDAKYDALAKCKTDWGSDADHCDGLFKNAALMECEGPTS